MTTTQSNQLAAIYNRYVTGDAVDPVRGSFEYVTQSALKTVTLGYKPSSVTLFTENSVPQYKSIIYSINISTSQFKVIYGCGSTQGSVATVNLGSTGGIGDTFNVTNTGFTYKTTNMTWTNYYYVACK